MDLQIILFFSGFRELFDRSETREKAGDINRTITRSSSGAPVLDGISAKI
jgi:hypothetical protein